MSKPLEIKLIDTKIRSLKFEMREVQTKEEVAFGFTINSGYEYDYRKKKLIILIRVLIDQDEMPFTLDIEYQGLFVLNKSVSKKNIEPFAKMNCPAILFPFVRECVADLTKRAGLSPLYLPAINFIELMKRQEKTKNKSSLEK
jgi:preprotein translocase subunit SecB